MCFNDNVRVFYFGSFEGVTNRKRIVVDIYVFLVYPNIRIILLDAFVNTYIFVM